MAKGRKKPKVKKSVKLRKRPNTGGVDPEALDDRVVAWRLGWLDLHGTWGWSNLDAGHRPALLEQLVAFEAETLHELKRTRRAKIIPVEQISGEAQDRLVEIERDDTDSLWELRIPTTEGWRAWGIAVGAIFYLLWWDPDHTVSKGLPKGISRQR